MISNKKGVTLIELLVVLALISIIFGLGFTIYNFGVVNFRNDSISASNQYNLRFAMNTLTKEIRKSPGDGILVDHANSTITIGLNVYILQDNSIKKNSVILISNIGQFNINRTGNIISIEIVSTPNTYGKTILLQTEIVVRG